MKKRKENTVKMLRMLAFVCLGLIAAIAFLTDYQTATGVTMAFALVIGSVTLEGKEEAIYLALKETIATEQEKFSKGYITEAKMLETITEKVKGLNVNLADNDEFKQLKKALEDMGITVKKMTENNRITPKSIREQIK